MPYVDTVQTKPARLKSMISLFAQSNMTMTRFFWLPWNLEFNARQLAPTGWVALFPGSNWYLELNLECENDEVPVFKLGPLCITRPETNAERREREEAELEDQFMEHELNRYTEWYY